VAEKKKLTNKERMQIPRQEMPNQKPEDRIKNFNEVPRGLAAEIAMKEAQRCLACPKPKCVSGCPVDVDIPRFIQQVAEGKFVEAAQTIKLTNALPAICGRVCPQDEQCEKECVLTKKYQSVGIGNLERFVADFEREQGAVEIPQCAPDTGKKVAIIGAGPAGLTAAADLAKLGHKVTIFEALHAPGGVLIYGIPEFRLPKSIVKSEVDVLRAMGVEIRTSYVIGKLDTIDELFEEGYNSVFIGTGAGLPNFMRIDGENLKGVYSANEYLTRSNLMRGYDFPDYDTPIFSGKNVAVLGGGNTAMDSVRTAKRLGADHAYIIYRRSRTEMPARSEEIHHAEEEGIEFKLLTNPVKFIGNDDGWLTHMECINMELGEPDASGRRRPVPIEGSNYLIPVDTVVVAIGNSSNPLIPQTTPGLSTNRWGNITVDEKTMMSSREGVFAGGDIVTGGATVILAAGAGKVAARAMHRYMMGLPMVDPAEQKTADAAKQAEAK